MFGPSYSPPNPSPAKWFFLAFCIIMGMAILVGVNIASATWFNPSIAAAQAGRLDVENAHQQAVYQLQEQLAQATTQADIQAIQRQQKLLDAQYQHDVQALDRDLQYGDGWFKTWTTLLLLLGGAVSFAIAVGPLLWIGSKALVNLRSVTAHERPASADTPAVAQPIRPLPEPEPPNPWNSPAYRYQKRVAAQVAEHQSRKKEIAARQKIFLD